MPATEAPSGDWSLSRSSSSSMFMSSAEAARLSVFKYVETFYNPVRLHQTLGYQSPDQYEAENATAQAA